MDTTSTLTFAAAAPIIALIMGIALNALPTKFALPARALPLVAVLLSAVYGAVLYYGGTYTGSIAEFIVVALTVGYAAAGIYQHGSEFSNVSFQNPFVVTPPPAPTAPVTSQAQIDALVQTAVAKLAAQSSAPVISPFVSTISAAPDSYVAPQSAAQPPV